MFVWRRRSLRPAFKPSYLQEKMEEDPQQTAAASGDTATGAKKKIFKSPKTDVGLVCQDNINATPLQDTGAKKKGKRTI